MNPTLAKACEEVGNLFSLTSNLPSLWDACCKEEGSAKRVKNLYYMCIQPPCFGWLLCKNVDEHREKSVLGKSIIIPYVVVNLLTLDIYSSSL